VRDERRVGLGQKILIDFLQFGIVSHIKFQKIVWGYFAEIGKQLDLFFRIIIDALFHAEHVAHFGSTKAQYTRIAELVKENEMLKAEQPATVKDEPVSTGDAE
jgi:hypothetical protein